MYTVNEIIEIAKVSGYLAANDIARGSLFGQTTDPRLAKMLYMERKAVEWMQNADSTDPTVRGSADYLYALCGAYALKAARIVGLGGSGTVVVPTTPSTSEPHINWIRVTSGDFDTATDYIDTSLDGEVFRVYANWITRYLEPNTEWEYLEGGGLRLIGWNAQTMDLELYIDLRNESTSLNSSVQWENIVGRPVAGQEYNLTQDTLISNPTSTTAYEEITISVIPNGFNYAWDTKFAFGFTWPEQPTATGVNTIQLYTFQYISSQDKWACIGQAIDVPI
jgi:hypothetical protein